MCNPDRVYHRRKQNPFTSYVQIPHSHIHPNAAARPNPDTSPFVSTMLFATPSRQKGSKLPNNPGSRGDWPESGGWTSRDN